MPWSRWCCAKDPKHCCNPIMPNKWQMLHWNIFRRGVFVQDTECGWDVTVSTSIPVGHHLFGRPNMHSTWSWKYTWKLDVSKKCKTPGIRQKTRAAIDAVHYIYGKWQDGKKTGITCFFPHRSTQLGIGKGSFQCQRMIFIISWNLFRCGQGFRSCNSLVWHILKSLLAFITELNDFLHLIPINFK